MKTVADFAECLQHILHSYGISPYQTSFYDNQVEISYPDAKQEIHYSIYSSREALLRVYPNDITHMGKMYSFSGPHDIPDWEDSEIYMKILKELLEKLHKDPEWIKPPRINWSPSEILHVPK